MTFTCTKCGVEHDGEPMRGWMARRGKDPDRVAVCAVCFVAVIENIADEAEHREEEVRDG